LIKALDASAVCPSTKLVIDLVPLITTPTWTYNTEISNLLNSCNQLGLYLPDTLLNHSLENQPEGLSVGLPGEVPGDAPRGLPKGKPEDKPKHGIRNSWWWQWYPGRDSNYWRITRVTSISFTAIAGLRFAGYMTDDQMIIAAGNITIHTLALLIVFC
jgi:hypothetical protein